MRPTENLGCQSQTRSACGIREAEGVLREHRRDVGRIALREVRVNTHRLGLSKPTDLAITQMPCSCAARRRCQCPKASRTRGRSEAKSIDGAEHSASLKYVMARQVASG
jgi:hypothetical protein